MTSTAIPSKINPLYLPIFPPFIYFVLLRYITKVERGKSSLVYFSRYVELKIASSVGQQKKSLLMRTEDFWDYKKKEWATVGEIAHFGWNSDTKLRYDSINHPLDAKRHLARGREGSEIASFPSETSSPDKGPNCVRDGPKLSPQKLHHRIFYGTRKTFKKGCRSYRTFNTGVISSRGFKLLVCKIPIKKNTSKSRVPLRRTNSTVAARGSCSVLNVNPRRSVG